MPKRVTISPGEIGPDRKVAPFTMDAMSGGASMSGCTGVALIVTGTMTELPDPGGEVIVK
jgi:hypothetical protein